MKRIPFGTLPDGRTAELCVLAGPRAEAAVSTLGATLVSVRTPDRNGSWADIALGFDAAADYLSRPGCLGATVGRYAGRIANGRFPLNGRTVELVKNRPAPHDPRRPGGLPPAAVDGRAPDGYAAGAMPDLSRRVTRAFPGP